MNEKNETFNDSMYTRTVYMQNAPPCRALYRFSIRHTIKRAQLQRISELGSLAEAVFCAIYSFATLFFFI